MHDSDKPVDALSFVRHPVFDQNRKLWGYQICCIDRSGDATNRLQAEGDVAGLVSSTSFIGLRKLLARGKRLLVPFRAESICEGIPYALPPAFTAVKVAEPMQLDRALLSALSKLKQDGYMIAVGHASGRPQLTPLYEIADIVCLGVSGKSSLAIAPIVERLHPFSVAAMSEQIEDQAHFDRCAGIGFSLFQGAFFKRAEQVSVRKLAANEASRFQLLKIIETPTPDFDKLTTAIQSDVTISLRLLSYLNSASMGLPQKIASIRQAIALLGWENMKKWLRVVVLSDVSRQKGAEELVLLSVRRGKFLELIVRHHDYWGFSEDSLFLLGIFSLLDALLGMPMERVVENLPLEEKLKAALCGDSASEYLPLLQLAEAMEDTDWFRADRLIRQLSLSPDVVKAVFHEAVAWADALSSLQP